MKNEWRLVVAITILILIVSFAILNGDSVPINYGFGAINAPLIIVMVVSLFLGSILTMVVSTSSGRKRKKELNSLRQKVDNHQFETEEAIKRAVHDYENRIQELETTLTRKDELIKNYEAEKQTRI